MKTRPYHPHLPFSACVAYHGRWIIGEHARHRRQVADISVQHAEQADDAGLVWPVGSIIHNLASASGEKFVWAHHGMSFIGKEPNRPHELVAAHRIYPRLRLGAPTPGNLSQYPLDKAGRADAAVHRPNDMGVCARASEHRLLPLLWVLILSLVVTEVILFLTQPPAGSQCIGNARKPCETRCGDPRKNNLRRPSADGIDNRSDRPLHTALCHVRDPSQTGRR